VAGSLLSKHNFEEEQGVLLVVSKNRLNDSMEQIVNLHESGEVDQPLSGIVITGDGRFEQPLDDFAHKDFVFKHNIPLITTPLDTYGTAVQISKMEIKINLQTVGKVKRAIELIKDYVDFDKISWQ
jgi:BioD-like phosphotransacetylase family protein